MIDREIITGFEIFTRNRPQVELVYKNAFTGPPWYENLSTSEVEKRLNKDQSRQGFESFLAQNNDGSVLGGLWYDTPSLAQLTLDRGDKLGEFATQLSAQHNITQIIWEREIVVDPQYQGQHIATDLRTTFLEHLSYLYPQGALILTRMKEDNYATIKIAQNLGYKTTGIKIESSVFPGQYHQYWYKVINSQPRNVIQ